MVGLQLWLYPADTFTDIKSPPSSSFFSLQALSLPCELSYSEIAIHNEAISVPYEACMFHEISCSISFPI